MKLAGSCKHCGGRMTVTVDPSGQPEAVAVTFCTRSPSGTCEPAPLPTAKEIADRDLRRQQSKRWGGAIQRRGKHR